MDTNPLLADEITAFVADALTGFTMRFCADDRLPRVLAGTPVSANATAELIHLYGAAHACGVDAVAGRACDARIRALVPALKGEHVELAASYQLAETLLHFGPNVEGHPLLQGQDEATTEQIREALDTTHIFDAEAEELISASPLNWTILARCEYDRSRLGLAAPPLTMRTALTRVQVLLSENPMSYVDDSPGRSGHFDLSTCEHLLTCEPFSDLLDPGPFRAALNAADRLLNLSALETGASVAWGHSTGATSLTTRIRLAALLLKCDACRTPARTLALAQDAFECFVTDWWRDDTVLAYRDRATGNALSHPHLLELSIGSLAALLDAVQLLRATATLPESGMLDESERYPPEDTLLRFAPGRGACWFYRNEHWTFQWPLISGTSSDDLAAPTHPTTLPQPAHSPTGCGVPLAMYGHEQFFPQACPHSVDKHHGGISFTQKGLISDGTLGQPTNRRTFTRKVKADVYGNTLQVRETWHFPAELPDVLSFHIAEAESPLEITWQCSSPHHACIIDVVGMEAWRSAWGPIQRLHQLDITPASEIHLAYTLTP